MPVGSRTVHEHLLHGSELPKSLIRKILPNNDSNIDNIKSPPGTLIRLERHPTANGHKLDFEQSQFASNGTRLRTVTTRLERHPTANGHKLASNGTTRLERHPIANDHHSTSNSHNSPRLKRLDRERSPLEVQHPTANGHKSASNGTRSRTITLYLERHRPRTVMIH